MPTIKEQCEQRIRELLPEIDFRNWNEQSTMYEGFNEPHLEHILLAIEKVNKQIRIDVNGDMFEWEDADELNGDWVWKAHYDLVFSFNQQADQFYSFLLEIIK